MSKFTFEDYLMKLWSESVSCTENDCLDDDQPDAFDEWLSCIEPDDFIKYADAFANIKYKEGYCSGLNMASTMIEKAGIK